MDEDDWLELPRYSHELEFYYHPGSGDVFRREGESYLRFQSLSRRANRYRLGACSAEGVARAGPLPQSGCWVDVEKTGDRITVLCQSLRAEAALRCHARMLSNETTDGGGLLERIGQLPEELRSLVGTVTMPPDDGQSIVDRWENDQEVIGISDGSAKDGMGTHAWKLCAGPEDPLAITGAGPVDGWPLYAS